MLLKSASYRKRLKADSQPPLAPACTIYLIDICLSNTSSPLGLLYAQLQLDTSSYIPSSMLSGPALPLYYRDALLPLRRMLSLQHSVRVACIVSGAHSSFALQARHPSPLALSFHLCAAAADKSWKISSGSKLFTTIKKKLKNPKEAFYSFVCCVLKAIVVQATSKGRSRKTEKGQKTRKIS